MVLMGVDYPPSFQQIAFFEEDTGECRDDWASRSHQGVRRSNRGRSLDRRDVWVGPKPTEGLRNEPWLSAQRLKENETRLLARVNGKVRSKRI